MGDNEVWQSSMNSRTSINFRLKLMLYGKFMETYVGSTVQGQVFFLNPVIFYDQLPHLKFAKWPFFTEKQCILAITNL